MTMKNQAIYQKDGISGAILKWLAMITMTIDHIGAGLIRPYNQMTTMNLDGLYTVTRLIGRLAFPIFAFLIVQGYQHTSNRRGYASKLFLFALISELPFDLAFNQQFFYWAHQNIFFALAIGVIGFSVFEKYEKKQQIIPQMFAFIAAGLLAEFINADYGLYGILFIFGLGILRDQKVYQTVFGVILGLGQAGIASLAFLPIWFYNGERGRQNKWFFYIFYPAHLLSIYLIRLFMI